MLNNATIILPVSVYLAALRSSMLLSQQLLLLNTGMLVFAAGSALRGRTRTSLHFGPRCRSPCDQLFQRRRTSSEARTARAAAAATAGVGTATTTAATAAALAAEVAMAMTVRSSG
jgi:hypothetical protein